MTKCAEPDKPSERTAAGGLGPSGTSEAFEFALDTLSAIGRAGLVIVPAAPTPEMLRAGAEAGEIPNPKVRRIYKAMLRASC